MLRRDIFNLLFSKNIPSQPVVPVPDPVIAAPEYLLNDGKKMNAFTLTLSTKSDSALLTAGIVQAGLQQGFLFIGGETDHRQLSKEVLAQEIKIILTVNPQPNGASYARILAKDQSGLTLAVLKSTKYTSGDWLGEIILSKAFIALSTDGLQTDMKNKIT